MGINDVVSSMSEKSGSVAKTMTVSIEVGGQFITTLMPQDALMQAAFEDGILRGVINKRVDDTFPGLSRTE